jgi:hypothetical protein
MFLKPCKRHYFFGSSPAGSWGGFLLGAASGKAIAGIMARRMRAICNRDGGAGRVYHRPHPRQASHGEELEEGDLRFTLSGPQRQRAMSARHQGTSLSREDKAGLLEQAVVVASTVPTHAAPTSHAAARRADMQEIWMEGRARGIGEGRQGYSTFHFLTINEQ